MNITFVGTGSAFNQDHKNNAAVLEFNDTNLLIDCGHTVPYMLEHSDNLKVKEIKNIFLTHMHGDHIYGIEEIAFRNRYIYNGRKINLFLPKPLYGMFKLYFESTGKHIMTPEGTAGTLSLEDYFNIKLVNSFFKINDETFLIEKTEHIPGAPAYMIMGEKFIFTGDTQMPNWEEKDLTGIEYIFHDTQLAKYGNDVHSTLPDILDLPNDIKSRIYCMHYGADIENYRNQIESAGMHIVESYKTINL